MWLAQGIFAFCTKKKCVYGGAKIVLTDIIVIYIAQHPTCHICFQKLLPENKNILYRDVRHIYKDHSQFLLLRKQY